MCIFDIGSKINSRARKTQYHIYPIFYIYDTFPHFYTQYAYGHMYIFMQKLEIFERRIRQFENLYSRLSVKYYLLIFLRIRGHGLRTYSHIYSIR